MERGPVLPKSPVVSVPPTNSPMPPPVAHVSPPSPRLRPATAPTAGSGGEAGGRGGQYLKPKSANTAKISLGENTYTIDESVGTIRVIRRSGRWKRGGGAGEQGDSPPGSAHTGGNLSIERCPPADSPHACREANEKLQAVISELKDEGVEPATLLSSLEYVAEVLAHLADNTEEDIEDDLSELTSEAVPDEVRKWLASTFAKQEQVVKRTEERPSFRSVANAIRTGIFIERIYRKMSTSQLMYIPPEIQQYLNKVDGWNFDVFSFARATKGSPLKFLGYHLLQKHGCLHKYKIPPSLLETLLGHLELGYTRNSNPYHNNLHASDVLQTTHWFISQTGIKDWLSDLEIFSLLFSAIIHDYDHTGTTNNFHIQSSSVLALLYNDRAVQENHHVAEFFKTMFDNECNILGNMSKSEFREFRNLMIEMVLHTDMSMHFSQLKSMKKTIESNPDGTSMDKTKLLSLLLHSCDVSHPAKRWDLHHQWTSRCMEEFFKQGDMERERGLEFSPLCDRQNTMVPQSQIGFIDFIVTPTLGVAGDAIALALGGGGDLQKPWLDTLAVNKSHWQKKAEDGETSIDTSDAVNDLKPPRMGSAARAERKENGGTDHINGGKKGEVPAGSPDSVCLITPAGGSEKTVFV